MMNELLILGMALLAAAAPGNGTELTKSRRVQTTVSERTGKVDVKPRLYSPELTRMIEIPGDEMRHVAKTPEEDEPEMITDPGIPVEDWIVEGYVGNAGAYSYSCLSMKYGREGNDIYVQGLIPSYYSNGYIKGDVQEDGKTVVFKMNQICDIFDMGDEELDLMFVANKVEISEEGIIEFDAEIDEEGYLKYNWCDAVATIREDGSLSFDGYMMAIWSYELDGMLNNIVIPTIYPKWDNFIEQPTDMADAPEYIYYFDNVITQVPLAHKVKAARKHVEGKDYLYLQGVCPNFPEGYIRGEVDGNTATFHSQYIGDDESFFELMPVNNIVIEEEWVSDIDPETGIDWGHMNTFVRFDECGSAKVSFNESDGKITELAIEEGYGLGFYNLGSADVCSLAKNIRYVEYRGDVPAVPMSPHDVNCSWHSDIDPETGEYYESWVGAFGFSLYNFDVDGNYINPEKLGWEVFADGELYTFTTEKFIELDHDMSLVPYGFVDPYDFYWLFWEDYGGVTAFGWPKEDMPKSWGVRSVYTVDGVTNYSPIVYCDLQPPTKVDYIACDKTVKEVMYIDVRGICSEKPFQGAMNIVKTIYTDGTSKIEKHVPIAHLIIP